MVHILLKPGLENFEHYFASMWDECHCAIDWIFFGIAFGIAWIMDYYSAMKDRKCWYMLQHGWTWKTWCEVKEAIHKRPYVLWFQFYIFKVQNRHIQEKAMTPHSSALAWKIPWTQEPGRLQSVGSLESDTTERLHFQFSLSCIGEGNGTPLQCSCLENPTDRGAWWAAVSGVSQSRTRLKWLSSSIETKRN